MFKRKPKDPKEHKKTIGSRYRCAEFKDGRFGMVLAYGVLDRDGQFYETGHDNAGNRDLKVLMGDQVVYYSERDVERFSVVIEYR